VHEIPRCDEPKTHEKGLPAKDFENVRSCSMKSSATGLGVRLFRVTTATGHGRVRIFDPSLPPTFSHLISPARRNILAAAGKIILE
jgi:hypothetical protein